ncbi:MAG TPA: phosphoglycerate mutase family protein [Candidatus Nanoarchaeia archaeon]|nr:phosphoglycerate mutase family protein [Candidatus Nanoarchaeia archaeon]
MRIFFVRHGQTNSNKEKKVQGQTIDEPLSEIGVQQVNELIQFL